MAKNWVAGAVWRASLEGVGILGPKETFPDWEGDPNEDEFDDGESNIHKSSARRHIYKEDLAARNYNRTIRLLELLPGDPSDDIQCVLTPHTLQAGMQKYEALSYCWGSPAATKPIYLDGNVLDVTVNLRSALRHLRLTKSSRMLWVDAICINQSNIKERSSQVKLMSEIYRNAAQVLVWLGLSKNHTESTFVLLENLASEAEEFKRHPEWQIDNKTNRRVEVSSDQQERIEELLFQDWFMRSWTVQEILSAKKALVISGWQSVSWHALSEAVAYASEQGRFLTSNRDYGSAEEDFVTLKPLIKAADYLEERAKVYSLIESSCDLEQRRESTQQLLELLSMFRLRLATDPRDKIYAFIGLVSEPQNLGIQADYGTSIETLCKTVAAQLILRTNSLALLKFLPLNNENDGDATHEFDDEVNKSDDMLEDHSSSHTNSQKQPDDSTDSVAGDFSARLLFAMLIEVFIVMISLLIKLFKIVFWDEYVDPYHDGTKLPSWAPNWESSDPIALPFVDEHGQQFGSTETHAERSRDIEISEDKSILTVSGYVYDEITEITETLPPLTDLHAFSIDTIGANYEPRPVEPRTNDGDPKWKETLGEVREGLRDIKEGVRELTGEFRKTASEFYKLILPLEILVRWEAFAGLPARGADKKKSDGTLVDLYRHTICAGAVLPEGEDATRAVFWEWYHTLDPIRNWQHKWYKRFKSFAKPMSFLGHARKTWSRFASFDRLFQVAFRRRLAKTKKGCLALVPRTTRVGDAVMLCRVSRFPLVIRKGNNPERWNFVGQAYIHDFADFDSSLCRPMQFE
ncbi:heterokaryon incompatibility protein-domain-containing protein [Xylaria venustula]|nr:heterokaryon incompatibility protein-domain-containing protein [Xylaria venustula]